MTTKLPTINHFQYSRPTAAIPKLVAPLSASVSDTTIKMNYPPLDENGDVLTGNFIIGVASSNGYMEGIYVPAGEVSGDGLTFTNVVRGIDLAGDDYLTANADLVVEHAINSVVICSISAVEKNLAVKAVKGEIGTGGNSLLVGNEVDEDITINVLKNSGTVGLVRHNNSTGYTELWNGSSWVSINSITDGTLVAVSSNDTTPNYLENKVVAGDNVTITVLNDGGNETIEIKSLAQREGVVEHVTYTPAFLTGGTNAEGNTALWDNVADGEFTVTINGVLRNVTGLDFTSIVTMADVAGVIQTGIRAVTGSTETCIWDTDHFVITSADATSSSAITVLSAVSGGTGTDISSPTWMDADVTNGVVTNKVLNASADSGKVPLLKADGKLSAELITADDTLTEDDLLVVDPNGGIKGIAPLGYRVLHYSTPDVEIDGQDSNINILALAIPANTPLNEQGMLKITIDSTGADSNLTGKSGVIELTIKANTTSLGTGAIGLAGTTDGPISGTGTVSITALNSNAGLRLGDFRYGYVGQSTTSGYRINHVTDTTFDSTSAWTLNLEITNNAEAGYEVAIKRIMVEYIKLTS